MNNTTVNNFVGFVPNNKNGWSFINDLRTILNGIGVRLRAYGRNKNRRQHAKTPHEHTKFRCNLPLKHATHYGLYLYAKNGKVDVSHMTFAKHLAISNRALYAYRNISLAV